MPMETITRQTVKKNLTHCKLFLCLLVNFFLTPLFTVSYGRLAAVTSTADAIRRRVITLLAERGISDAEFASHLQKTRQWAHQWLRKGKHGITSATLDKVSAFFGEDVTQTAHVTNGPVTSPDRPTKVSFTRTGDSHGGLKTNHLERELAVLQARYDALRAAVVGVVDSFGDLIARQDAEAARSPSASRANAGRHARQLSKEPRRGAR